MKSRYLARGVCSECKEHTIVIVDDVVNQNICQGCQMRNVEVFEPDFGSAETAARTRRLMAESWDKALAEFRRKEA